MPKRTALRTPIAVVFCLVLAAPAQASPPAGWPADQINLTVSGSAGGSFDGTYAFPWDDAQAIYWRELPPSYDPPVIYGNINPSHSTFELYGIIANETDADTPWGTGTVTLVNSHPVLADWSGTGQLAGASIQVPEPSSMAAGVLFAAVLVPRRRCSRGKR